MSSSIQEKLISKSLDEVAQDTKFCFGIKDTMQGLDMGAVERLIVWEELDLLRIKLHNPHTDKEEVLYLTPKESKCDVLYRCLETKVELTVMENELFVEWIVNNYKSFGAKIDFVTDRSQEGHQFCKGFGGVGGLLRYQVELELFAETEDLEDSDDDFM